MRLNVYPEKTSKNSENKTKVNIIHFPTKLGPMFACSTNKGICLLDFDNKRRLERELKDLIKRLDAVILPGENSFLSEVQKELKEYFSGERKRFDVALDPVGTDFQKSVWKVLQSIPYGETWSYKEQAKTLGKINAVRAVANANGYNKIGIIIPCHRVIGSDGSLTGYGGGLDKKEWLIGLEQKYK